MKKQKKAKADPKLLGALNSLLNVSSSEQTKLTTKPIGWQIVAVETDDPPLEMATYELYSLEYVLAWIQAHPKEKTIWRLLPIFEGDVEEPTDMTSLVFRG